MSVAWGPAAVLVAAIVTLGLVKPAGLQFAAMLFVAVCIHEWGHWFVARRSGMRPTEAFCGFGPKIVSFTGRDGCEYGVKAVLLGGYVRIPGMTPSEPVDEELEPYTYRAATRWRRSAVILAGVTVNLVTAVVVLIATAVPRSGFVGAVPDGLSIAQQAIGMTYRGLWAVVSDLGGYFGSVTGDAAPPARFISPVGGAKLTERVNELGVLAVLRLFALINLGLAAMNLLPLVPLDGGHFAVLCAEGATARVRRRPGLRFDANRLAPVAMVVLLFFVAVSLAGVVLDITKPVL